MSNTNELPLNLYKTNLELQVKLGRLLQETGKQWIDYGYSLINNGIAESNTEADELLRSENWQKLATLPVESFWQQLRQRFGDSQALAQIAIDGQTDFVRGLQEAVQEWQKETSTALSHVVPATSFGNSGLADLFKPWEQLLSTAGAIGKATAGRSAAKGAK